MNKEEAMKELEFKIESWESYIKDGGFILTADEIKRAQEAIDVFETATKALKADIVFCRECKYGGDYDCHHKYGLKFYRDNDYCSYGIRESEELMSREIKFKIWDKEEKKFLEIGSDKEDKYEKGKAYIKHGSEGVYYTLIGYKDENGYDYEIDAEIMQYTGLKDKNEKEIYEGDIVKVSHYDKLISKGFVKFSNCGDISKVTTYGFGIDYGNGNYTKLCSNTEYEIIGNVYDNSELLENKGDK